MKKIVLHIVNSNIFSGLENVACEIILHSSKDFEQIYVTQNGPIIDTLKEKKISHEIINKMSVKEIRRVVKKYNADIIHAHDFTASCVVAMSLIKKTIISHLHHNAPWLKKINLKTLLYLFCSLRFKKILIVSDAIKNEYVFSKFLKKKIKCIGNPVSVQKILNMVEDSDYEKKYDICCVGRLTEAKDPIRWLSIISEVKKQIPSIKAIWVGDGELKKEFIEKIKILDLIKNVQVLGFQNNPYKYIASSKLYLQTSSWEGFGLTAFESLSLRVPAIVSNVGGLKNIVDNTCGKLCESDNDFIRAVLENLNNKNLYNVNSKNAYEKAQKLDNTSKYYKEINNIYLDK